MRLISPYPMTLSRRVAWRILRALSPQRGQRFSGTFCWQTSHQYSKGDVSQTVHPASLLFRLQMHSPSVATGGFCSGFIPLSTLPAFNGYTGPKTQQSFHISQPAQDRKGSGRIVTEREDRRHARHHPALAVKQHQKGLAADKPFADD